MGLFGRTYFLDADDESWQVKTWRAFLDNFGGMADLKQSPLVTPTGEFFPASDTTGEKRAEYIFSCVKRHARMADWHCILAPQPNRPQRAVSEFVVLQPITKGLPLGTFRLEGNEAVITYDPEMINSPAALIATLAHELAHYRLGQVRDSLPGGEGMHEFATDLMAVYLGFGIFEASLAFNFRQFSETGRQGWSASRHGYLSERAFVFALAVFLELRGQSSDDAKPFLKSNLLADLRTARAYLVKHDLLSAITNPAGSPHTGSL